MESRIRVALITVIIFTLALSMAGCVKPKIVCVPGDFTLRERGAKVTVLVPVAVKKESEPCKNGVVVKGIPKAIRLLWRTHGEGEEWKPLGATDNAKQVLEFVIDVNNVEQVLEYKIDVNALGVPLQEPPRGEGPGPYTVTISPVPTEPYVKGRELGSKHQSGQLRTYRLLIAFFDRYFPPSKTYEYDTVEFLRGFKTGHAEAGGDTDLAKRVEGVLGQSMSLAHGRYEQALDYGKRYVNNDVSDAEIERFIRVTFNEPGCELGVKAGYIEGMFQTHPGTNKESSYETAELMYFSLVPLDRGSGKRSPQASAYPREIDR